MKCPYCGYKESKVVDSRPAEEGSSIRRRRECLSCEKRFTTYETVESLPMVVIKKDGSRQSFDRSKVLRGMIRACEKRPVSFDELERISEEIEQNLHCLLYTSVRRRRSRWRTRNFFSASSMPLSPCAARRSSTA